MHFKQIVAVSKSSFATGIFWLFLSSLIELSPVLSKQDQMKVDETGFKTHLFCFPGFQATKTRGVEPLAPFQFADCSLDPDLPPDRFLSAGMPRDANTYKKSLFLPAFLVRFICNLQSKQSALCLLRHTQRKGFGQRFVCMREGLLCFLSAGFVALLPGWRCVDLSSGRFDLRGCEGL